MCIITMNTFLQKISFFKNVVFVYIKSPKRTCVFLYSDNEQQLVRESVLPDDTCQTRDSVSAPNSVSSADLYEVMEKSLLCKHFFSGSMSRMNKFTSSPMK